MQEIQCRKQETDHLKPGHLRQKKILKEEKKFKFKTSWGGYFIKKRSKNSLSSSQIQNTASSSSSNPCPSGILLKFKTLCLALKTILGIPDALWKSSNEKKKTKKTDMYFFRQDTHPTKLNEYYKIHKR